MSESQRPLAVTFHPGEFLSEELDARGFSVDEFASLIAVPETSLRAVLSGNARMTFSLAEQVGTAFGQSPHYWANLQRSYDLNCCGD